MIGMFGVLFLAIVVLIALVLWTRRKIQLDGDEGGVTEREHHNISMGRAAEDDF